MSGIATALGSAAYRLLTPTGVPAATWTISTVVARQSVLYILKGIRHGQLVVQDLCAQKLPDPGEAERKLVFGQYDGRPFTGPVVVLTVKNVAAWLRILIFADMGFAEAYMLGEIECSDLVAFFELFIVNREYLSNGTTLSANVLGKLTGLLRSANSMSNSLLNTSAHYDISNDMFAAFLSDDMTYSCPIWLPKSDPKAEDESLESAQERKLDYMIRHARIKAEDHVLEIGTGWGSFAIQAVQQTRCKVTSLTLSIEQKRLAEKRIAAAGLSDRITVLLCDYRELPVPRSRYDKVVSIEMLEAVGPEYLSTYFECIDNYLKPDGIAVFQCITMPESRYDAYRKGEDFIRRYIFPGGHLPTVTQLVKAIEKGTGGRLIVDEMLNIGGHYARTLRCWNEEFLQNFDTRIRPALLETYPEMSHDGIELFRRKWQYYFAYCEAGFATKTLGDIIITASREGAMEMIEDIIL